MTMLLPELANPFLHIKVLNQNPRGWVNKCEKCFQLNPHDDERTKILRTIIYLESEADLWYRSVELKKP